jgi:hypothetical protein
MRDSSRSGWSWRYAAGLVVIAALAQACGGSSSQSSGSQTGRAEFRFSQVKTTRLAALPQGCTEVKVTFQPGNLSFSINDTQGSFIISAGQYVASAVALCNGNSFPSDKPDPVVIVPAGLGEVSVSFVFGDINVTLTVVAGPGVSVTGDGINCPSDCTQTFVAGTSVKLTANNPAAVFTGGCNGTGSCTALMNQDKTVNVGLVAGTGTIRVDNTGDPEESFELQITVDGSTVAAELGPNDPPVNVTVASGSHQVRAFCLGEGPFEHPSSPQNVTVTTGVTSVNFDADTCFQQIQLRRRR